MRLLFLLFLVQLSLFSCEELTGEATGANNTFFDNLIGGVGAINIGNQKNLFNGQASSIKSKANFILKFNLPESETLTFHFYCFKDLSEGLNLSFTRENQKVLMTMSLGNTSHTHELEEFAGIDTIDITMDVHNDHPNIHNLIWERGATPATDGECTFDNTCIYNTESFGLDDDFNPLWSKSGQASGTFWGMSGDKDLIIEIKGFLEALRPNV